jgi:chloride channel protein, CIC family
VQTTWVPARVLALAIKLVQVGIERANRLSLPGPAVLPIAGAVIGMYSGLLAGIFGNLITLVSSLTVGMFAEASQQPFLERLWAAVSKKNWHGEFLLLAGVPAGMTLWLSQKIREDPSHSLVKTRLRILSLLILGALGLYYPLVGLTVLNLVLRGSHATAEHQANLPAWATLAIPALGGCAVGWMLRHRPETHGHGIPEVQKAIKADGEGLGVRGGLLKLVASATTIGTGGSAGREGPIVYGGAAIASGVGRTLGFTTRELNILLASGAGAGIAASFNAPIAGAIFAFEIILREFELKVLSPIILASVTATMVGRGVMGAAPLLRRFPYRMVSGFELVSYVALGLLCGLLAYAFIRLLHWTEHFFAGHVPVPYGGALRKWPLPLKAALGGLLVGGLSLIHPAVWGTGHHFTNVAAAGKLGFTFLLTACLLKLVATAITIGSGGSGGTFFPATVIGAMAGGAFGELLHRAAPSITAPSGAYALVGMGGAVAGLTRGPLTGMMMIYELTGNYQIILPLMVACTISSALCHFLVERKQHHRRTTREMLTLTPVRAVMVCLTPVSWDRPVGEVVNAIVSSGETALPVTDASGKVQGVIQLHDLHEVWGDEALVRTLRVADVRRTVPVMDAEQDLYNALRAMNREDIDVLPAKDDRDRTVGLITRAAIRRYLKGTSSSAETTGEFPVAPTEVDR